MALFTAFQCGFTVQSGAIVQLHGVCVVQLVIAIGPSIASIMSARLIAAEGRASLMPPPAPRTDFSSPARVSRLTSFCAVGSGMPVSAASSVALVRAPPQCRAAAPIITTA